MRQGRCNSSCGIACIILPIPYSASDLQCLKNSRNGASFPSGFKSTAKGMIVEICVYRRLRRFEAANTEMNVDFLILTILICLQKDLKSIIIFHGIACIRTGLLHLTNESLVIKALRWISAHTHGFNDQLILIIHTVNIQHQIGLVKIQRLPDRVSRRSSFGIKGNSVVVKCKILANSGFIFELIGGILFGVRVGIGARDHHDNELLE